METGKILPLVRQFFGTTRADRSDRDSPSPRHQKQEKERDATEEEARKAAALLQESEEFRKNGLTVAVVASDGKFTLRVSDSSGNQLRTIHGLEIVKILLAAGTPDSPRQGRILDRRI